MTRMRLAPYVWLEERTAMRLVKQTAETFDFNIANQ